MVWSCLNPELRSSISPLRYPTLLQLCSYAYALPSLAACRHAIASLQLDVLVFTEIGNAMWCALLTGTRLAEFLSGQREAYSSDACRHRPV